MRLLLLFALSLIWLVPAPAAAQGLVVFVDRMCARQGKPIDKDSKPDFYPKVFGRKWREVSDADCNTGRYWFPYLGTIGRKKSLKFSIRVKDWDPGPNDNIDVNPFKGVRRIKLLLVKENSVWNLRDRNTNEVYPVCRQPNQEDFSCTISKAGEPSNSNKRGVVDFRVFVVRPEDVEKMGLK